MMSYHRVMILFKVCFCEFHSPIKQANCKTYIQYCALHCDGTCLYKILHSAQISRSISAYTKFHFKLCVKHRSRGIKSFCIIKSKGKSINNCMYKIILCVYFLPTLKQMKSFFKICALCSTRLCLQLNIKYNFSNAAVFVRCLG